MTVSVRGKRDFLTHDSGGIHEGILQVVGRRLHYECF